MLASSNLIQETGRGTSKTLWYTAFLVVSPTVTNLEQESFYKAQADVYDATRTRLLRGREDMLGLVAAQLKHRCEAGSISQRPVWVDVGWVY